MFAAFGSLAVVIPDDAVVVVDCCSKGVGPEHEGIGLGGDTIEHEWRCSTDLIGILPLSGVITLIAVMPSCQVLFNNRIYMSVNR